VTQGSSGRSLSVLSLRPLGTAAIRSIRDFSDLSGRREFGNMGRQ